MSRPIGEGAWTPLHFAAHAGKLASVESLLACEANVDTADSFGNTALLLAAHGGHWDTVQRLLEANASAGLASGWTGYTALHYAALRGAPAIILDALVARGASVNSSSAKDGQTALHLAARHGRTESAAQLVAHGADLSLENDVGLTPGRLAAKSGFPQLAELLETAPELEAVPEEMPEPLTSPQGRSAAEESSEPSLIQRLSSFFSPRWLADEAGWRSTVAEVDVENSEEHSEIEPPPTPRHEQRQSAHRGHWSAFMPDPFPVLPTMAPTEKNLPSISAPEEEEAPPQDVTLVAATASDTVAELMMRLSEVRALGPTTLD